jgi:hypothetical protein
VNDLSSLLPGFLRQLHFSEELTGELVIELTPAEQSWFVPFDTIRISQSREEADGRLAETVELFSRRNGEEVPFMRMSEEGIVYRPTAPCAGK